MPNEPERNPRKVLGKGLSALLPTRSAPTPESQIAPAAAKPPLPENFEEFQNIPLDQLHPGEEQPRDVFDTDKIQELSQSIRIHGVLQPIVVYRDRENRYRIIAGERRWRAARLAGLAEIPALVRTVDRDRLLELSLIENIQREDLNPIEIASAFHRLTSHHGLSHEQIAERTGKDRSTVTNFLRLLRLGERAQHELRAGTISVGHARALLNMDDHLEQARLCDEIIAKKLSVREIEALVKKLAERPQADISKEKSEDKRNVDPNVRAALEELEMALGTKVRLVPTSAAAGRLEIQYYSQDDLDRIYSVIVK
jgi:ParB family transcriptional regulator, chromosome partitioning protein